MYLVVVRAFAETASFRVPETHTFHKTLPLPPYTTCTGILGAALGLPLEAAQAYVESNDIAVGVAGTDRGGFKDLWKYRKIKAKETISDVLLREYRVDLCLLLAFGTQQAGTAREVERAFRDPVYALTAGHSDSLMHIRCVETMEQEPQLLRILKFCMVPGDLTGRYTPDPSVFDVPITETIRAPLVAHLPVRFEFDGELRTVAERELFTFVGHTVELTEPLLGYQIHEDQVVLR